MKKYLIVILALALAVGGADAQKKGGKAAGAGGPSKATGTIGGYEYVDLGLPSGMVWATCNVGASSPEGYGNYYAWGYTTPWAGLNKSDATEYKTLSELRSYGYIDENNELKLNHDAARANWGSTWWMPTYDNFVELQENTTQKKTAYKGVKGCLFTSKINGKSIFIPAAGFDNGEYRGQLVICWSSTVLGDYDTYSFFYSTGIQLYIRCTRFNGLSVRPVSKPPVFITPEQKESMTASDKIADHDYVDLGLPSGLKWATCNVGASSPEGYGDYFAWGETTTKSSYDEDNCPTKGKDESWLLSNGYINMNGNLTPEHDAAHAQWGSTWRLPTKDEIQELVDNTTSTWVTDNAVEGLLVTSKSNGKSIFIPAAGWCDGSVLKGGALTGNFWSSMSSEKGADYFNVKFDEFKVRTCARYSGLSVRPVSGGKDASTTLTESMAASGMIGSYNYVDLGLPSGLKWATCNVGASTPKDYGDYYVWGETTTQSSYDRNNCPAYNKNSTWLLLNGYTDMSGNLSMAHDAARAQCGSSWRMPTQAEIDELMENTSSRWITYNGVKGHLLTSKRNGKSIFLPAAGYRSSSIVDAGSNGRYSSSSPYRNNTDDVCCISLSSDNIRKDDYSRYYGTTIRPVADGKEAALTLTESIAPTALVGGHEYVDLGLPSGLKWATCNIGATAPEGYGDYFAWGETKTKKNYDKSSTDKKDNEWLKKKGYIDDSGNLTPKYDAATAQWGATWRMPSKAEIDELVENTTTMWITYNGVKGRLVTSKINNKSIFLPAAGCRYGKELRDDGARAFYFSSTPHESEFENVNNLFFNPSLFNSGNGAARSCGHSVRPVSK